MGCVVSHHQTRRVNIAQTPREKPHKSSDFPQDFKEPEYTKPNCDEYHNKQHQNERNEQNNAKHKELFVLERTDSIVTKRKIGDNDNSEHVTIKRTSSIRGYKESDFSFKSTPESPRAKDSSYPQHSSHQNFDGHNSNKSMDLSKKSEHSSESHGPRGHSRTPSYHQRPSGFLLERKNSLHRSSQHLPSTGSLIPHDLKGDSINTSHCQSQNNFNASLMDEKLSKGSLNEAKLSSKRQSSTDELPQFGALAERSKDHFEETMVSFANIGSTSKPSTFLRKNSLKYDHTSNGRLKKQMSIEQNMYDNVGRNRAPTFSRNTSQEVNPFFEVKSQHLHNNTRPSSPASQNKCKRSMSQEQQQNNHPYSSEHCRVTLPMLNTIRESSSPGMPINESVTGPKEALLSPKPGSPRFNPFTNPLSKSSKTSNLSLKPTRPGSNSSLDHFSSSFGGPLNSIRQKSNDQDSSSRKNDSPKNDQPGRSQSFKTLFASSKTLSGQAKFRKNLLDIVDGESDDETEVSLALHGRGLPRQESRLSGPKEVTDRCSSQDTELLIKPSRPTTDKRPATKNLLDFARQESQQDHTQSKESSHFSRVERKNPFQALDAGSGHNSPINTISRLHEQDSYILTANTRGMGPSNNPVKGNDTSVIYDAHTIYNPEENISAANVTKYDWQFENAEIEYDEANGINLNSINHRANILVGLGNSDESPTGLHRRDMQPHSPLRIRERSCLRRDSNPNKDSIIELISTEKLRREANDGHSTNPGADSVENPIVKKDSIKTYHKPLKNSKFQPEASSKPRMTMAPKQFKGLKKTNRTFRRAKSCLIASDSDEPDVSANEGANARTLGKVQSDNFPKDKGEEVNNQTSKTTKEKSMAEIAEQLKSEEDTPALQLAKISASKPTSKPKGAKKKLKGHVLKRTSTVVIETQTLDKTKDNEGQKKINQYIMIKDLGKGAFGKVKLAQDNSTNAYYAIKIVNKLKLRRKMIGRTRDTASTLQKEIAIMKKLEHPNIVKLWEVIDDPNDDKLYLVMDYIKKGAAMSDMYWRVEGTERGDQNEDCQDQPTPVVNRHLSQGQVLSDKKAMKYFRELILGLDYLHSHACVIHRDIKPENLLIDHEDNLKISDFGVSHIMDDNNNDNLKNKAGTKFFLPPEAFAGKKFHGKPADIWAAGATLYYFLTAKPPFKANNQQELQQKIFNTEPEYPETMDPKIRRVIESCLIKDPDHRANLREILTSDLLTEEGQYVVENRVEPEDHFEVLEQDIGSAITGLKFRATVMLTAKMKSHLNKTREKIVRKRTMMLDEKDTSENDLLSGNTCIPEEQNY